MPAPHNILGVSAYYHAAAAALVRDGEIISAAQEERFTRKKMIPTSRVTPSNFVSIIVRHERVQDHFELDVESPYMLRVAPVKKELCREVSPDVKGFDRLKEIRSTLPAITHVDYSARIQTMERQGNPLLYDLLLRFEQATGCGVLLNTAFNVRGEPIVCTPDGGQGFVATQVSAQRDDLLASSERVQSIGPAFLKREFEAVAVAVRG
jgi:predicted NodU family carbamoyl transferase